MSDYKFQVLEVHTLHVRDFSGEKIVQALGDFRELSVNTACVESEMRAVIFPVRRILVKVFPFMIIFLAGLVLTFMITLYNYPVAFRIIRPAALFCGGAGMFDSVRKILSERKVLLSLTRDKALEKIAFKCAVESAPAKYNDNDLSYILVDEIKRAESPEELAEKYNLLPAISRKAIELVNRE
ncbi:MAG: hypothetical protein IJP48_05830 [Synergistaceae bacterium]|nr:hypothetical protein [Synergistaceae bacterium]